ncbi:MAG: ribonuclease III domain-containing protein, partial [Clostridia bacterium]
MQELEKAIEYSFCDAANLSMALTHPSTNLPDNQRLEFLGDAILEFCVSDMLYRKYPSIQEGELTARRAALVCERTLSILARSLGLGGWLLMGHGEEQTGGREKPSILADALEAVLAAIYVDGGYEAVRTVILRLF